ncbi:helicase C-terminal domain-domain-containing protein [Catenaria anguillulae PL171]|uniref:ATP-dependent DNA helicase CHL1 n=1 Tax=Catenaria anguillulae PL171 TaxID=765915 RepID=A0A1Y2I215_9FUNG|nr:helicase C-terminal domain-domain-containing protein [Catenaria anguillulae PL171]
MTISPQISSVLAPRPLTSAQGPDQLQFASAPQTTSDLLIMNGSNAASASSSRDYGFPFPPYPIQVDLMDKLYDVLTRGGIGLLESPTGTGKSLSLIAGSFTWLRDNLDNPDLLTNVNDLPPPSASSTTPLPSAQTRPGEEDDDDDHAEPDWVREQAAQLARDRKLEQVRRFQTQVRDRIERIRHSSTFSSVTSSTDYRKRSKTAGRPMSKSKLSSEDDEDLVVDYTSDSESAKHSATDDPLSLLANPTAFLTTVDEEDELIPPDFRPPQILYVSRTHSQITQFIREFRKTKHAIQPGLDPSFSTPSSGFSAVSLASRKNLCINADVLAKARGNASRVNELCMDLQKASSSAPSPTNGCPHLVKPGQLNAFRDHVLAQAMDIEDLVSLGTQLSACPYYGARKAAPVANLVALPYTGLIHPDTRDALGVRVRGNVVVVDEAHNLADAVVGVHSVDVDGRIIERAYNQLAQYLEKYRARLKSGNRVYVQQTLVVLGAVHVWMKKQMESGQAQGKLVQVSPFMFELDVDQINLFKLVVFLRESGVTRKVMGFVEKAAEVMVGAVQDEGKDDGGLSRHVSPLAVFERFLSKLVEPDEDGRPSWCFLRIDLACAKLKYLALNPASHFADIVRDAHSVILAGGTMHPMSDFTDFLFPNRFGKPLETYSCGHVIPRENVTALVVPRAPSGRVIKCTMEARKDPQLFEDIGQVLSNLVNITPRGMVVFLSSFSMLDDCMTYFRDKGVVARMERKKKVFTEPRDAQALEQVLQSNGAVLFAVVGGKMSEGINFSDHLARCVVMVGVPYPNRGSVELNEKLKYIDSQSPGASAEYYENLCMRAVNQSIGRAIRHRNDFAAIVLVDVRYDASPSIRAKLPKWISDGMATPDMSRPFGHTIRSLVQFYKTVRTGIK